ncbi:TonB family protein [Pseudoxanthomonas helianthi]|uniref:TonB family protein n=1 Tax=Pseudoxanthomonas helianthi TaxID=1453541 RepID=A0A940X3P6_9GAMM|nr:TonB family protein [Pseudoxanthomonas helianthi]MBP3984115.1 TonB family protein [Pseudoxanthomonas helianthi]
MKIVASMVVLPLLFATSIATPNGTDASKPVVFRAGARVAVDATGKPTSVQASEDLPDAVRGYIERRIAGWRFDVPQREGVPVGGVTYVVLGACAMPAKEGYRLGMDFKSNGPGLPKDWLTPPRYPPNAARAGNEANMDVTYAVESDGNATLEEMKFRGARPPAARDFDASVREWIARLRFEPEQVAGQPVRTRTTVPVDFSLGNATNGRRLRRAEKDETKGKSLECEAATGYEYDQVVLDSPFKLINSN